MDSSTPPNPNLQQITPLPPKIDPTKENVPNIQSKNTKRSKIIKIIIISAVGLLIIIISVYFLIKLLSKRNSSLNISKTTYQSDSSQYTNYQFDDSNKKDLITSCFTAIIPSSAKITSTDGDDCTLNITMPDTTEPFARLSAINDTEGMSIKDAAYRVKDSYANKYSPQITDDVSIGGFNSYLLRYNDGAFYKKAYFIEVPDNKNYLADGKKVIGFLINGYDNDPQADVFTKYFNLLTDNLKFK